jgi:hypothetical protein
MYCITWEAKISPQQIRSALSRQWERPGDSLLKQSKVTRGLKETGQLGSCHIPKTGEVSVLIDITRVVIRTQLDADSDKFISGCYGTAHRSRITRDCRARVYNFSHRSCSLYCSVFHRLILPVRVTERTGPRHSSGG